MKRIISFFLVCILCILCICTGCSNSKQQIVPVIGRYYLDKEGSTSYIEVLENNYLLFSGVNFTDIEKNTYENWAISLLDHENEKAGISLTEEERDAKIQEIRDEIDLDKQFSDKMSQFEFIEENDESGFTSPVNASTLSLVVLYQPSEHTLNFNEHKYILRQDEGI